MALARALLLWLACGLAVAQGSEMDQRVSALANELRCLVCQNQTLADSNAPLAVDLRNQIREQLAAGKSEQEVTDFMVARYGDFVLYRPPLKATTVALWVGPFVFLAF
ncbi:MAG TPA: cytochrome c-type biogenesis protein, partial [Burkholderiales bacterium]|nr:cytochrome c-type biogenesis protein [Burkholderiales bacterium]